MQSLFRFRLAPYLFSPAELVQRGVAIVIALLFMPTLGCNKKTGSELTPASTAELVQSETPSKAPSGLSETAESVADAVHATMDNQRIPDSTLDPLSRVDSEESKNGEIIESAPTLDALQADVDSGRSTWRRYIFLCETGPILIDFQFAIHHESLLKRVARVQDSILPELFKFTSDQTTWTEILNAPKISRSIFSNLRPTDEKQKKDLIGRYDSDGNGKPSQRELHTYLTRGIADRDVVIFDEANRFRGENMDQSQIFSQIDADHDGIFSEQELRESSKRISIMDTNSDFIVTAAEVRPLEMNPQAFMRQRSQSADDAFLRVDGSIERESAKAILRRYSFSNSIFKDDWPLRGDLFMALDSNNDGELDGQELKAISSTPSDVVVQLRWNANSDGDEKSDGDENAKGSENVEFRFNKRVDNSWTSVLDAPVLELGGARFRFELNDPLSPKNFQVRVDQIASQLAVTREKSREVEEMESSQQNQPTLEGLDFDGDKMVTYAEVEKAVRIKTNLTEPFIRVRAIDPPDAWFVWLDKNWDDVLSEKEIADAPNRITANRNSPETLIAAGQVPMQIQIVLGRSFGDEPPFAAIAPSSGNSRTGPSGPEWFQAMDANSDGIITIREFLGDPTIFEKMDLNNDRILTPSEVESDSGELTLP